MQRIRISTRVLLAVSMAGALAADASVAKAQEKEDKDRARADTPKAPQTTMPEKTGEERPGPLDVVVQFQGNSAKIDVGANAALDATAEWLKEDSSHIVTIEMHPDEAVRAELDHALVDERADTTRRYLMAQGVSEAQIRVLTTGEHAGAVDRNQRAVFLMTLESGAVASASAEVPDTTPMPPPPAERMVRESDPLMDADDDYGRRNRHLGTPFGMAVSIGGGVVGFLDKEARQLGDVGGSWEARLTIGTRSPLAVEAAYIGSAQKIDALGLDRGAVLVGTLLETDLRINFTTQAVQPYVFGGIGYTRYDVTNDDFNTSSVNDEEEMGHIPLGGGVAYQWGGFLLDVRGTFRPAFKDDLVTEPASEDDPLDETDTRTDLDTWNVAARLGWEF